MTAPKIAFRDAPKIAFRDVQESDLAYIIHGLMKVGRFTNRNSYMSKKDFASYHKLHIIQLLARPYTRVRIAHLTTEPDYIISFIVYSFDSTGRLIIHYVNTQRDFRRNGFLRKLITDIYDPSQPIVVSTYHKVLPALMKKFPNITYNPYIAARNE